MAKKALYQLEAEIDHLNNSIQNTISGDSFATEIFAVEKAELKAITKANGWNFDWKAELKESDRQVFKLVIVGNSHII